MTQPITSSVKLMILELLEASLVGATDQEMQTLLGLDPSVQRPRRVELVQAGRVRASALRRRTAFGELDHTVWEIAPEDALKPPRPASKKRALEPFLAKADALAQAMPGFRDHHTVTLTITLGACRELLRAYR